MKRTPRVLAAFVAATALTVTGVHTADAKPGHAGADKAAKSERAASKGGHGGQGAASKLERTVARKVAQLERTVSAQRLRRVDPAHATVVVANVDADQAALEALVTAPPADIEATLKGYRVENYRLAVNILRQAAQAGETTEAEAAAIADAVELALAITATSSKADVKAARAAFDDADELLEDGTDEAQESEEPEVTDEPEGSDEPEGTDEVPAV